MGTPGSRSPARLFRATPRPVRPADGLSIGSQPAGDRQFVSQPAEQTETLRTSRNAIKIINQAVRSGCERVCRSAFCEPPEGLLRYATEVRISSVFVGSDVVLGLDSTKAAEHLQRNSGHRRIIELRSDDANDFASTSPQLREGPQDHRSITASSAVDRHRRQFVEQSVDVMGRECRRDRSSDGVHRRALGSARLVAVDGNQRPGSGSAASRIPEDLYQHSLGIRVDEREPLHEDRGRGSDW
jgi:hypothetical protein